MGPDSADGEEEQTDVHQVASLQYLQWTVPQYCCSTLVALAPCLKASADEAFIIHLLELMQQVAGLLEKCVVGDEELWSGEGGGSVAAREMVRAVNCVNQLHISDSNIIHKYYSV